MLCAGRGEGVRTQSRACPQGPHIRRTLSCFKYRTELCVNNRENIASIKAETLKKLMYELIYEQNTVCYILFSLLLLVTSTNYSNNYCMRMKCFYNHIWIPLLYF